MDIGSLVEQQRVERGTEMSPVQYCPGAFEEDESGSRSMFSRQGGDALGDRAGGVQMSPSDF